MPATVRLRAAAAGATPPVPATITHVGGSTAIATATSLSVTQPGGIASGDVGFLAGVGTGAPSGWTAGSGCYYKVYGGSEGSVTVPSSGGTQAMVVALAVFRGVNTGSPIDAASTATSFGSGTSLTSNAATAVHAATMLLSVAYEYTSNSGTPTLTPSGGLTESAQAKASHLSVAFDYGAGPAAGAPSATPTWTSTLAVTSAGVTNVLLRAAGT